MKRFVTLIALIPCITLVAAYPQGASQPLLNDIRLSERHGIHPEQKRDALAVTQFDSGCGLEKPTAQQWTANLPAIKTFTESNYKEFKNDSAQSSFAIYLRDKYASNAAPSELFCDAVGACSIGSCLNLNQDYPKHEQQIAYLVFEQLAGVAHHLQASARATLVAGDWTIRQVHSVVERFSDAERTEEALKSSAMKEKIGLAAGTAMLILGAGAFEAGTFFFPAVAAVAAGKLAHQLITAVFISTFSVLNAERKDIPDFSGNLELLMTGSVNSILHERETRIDQDLQNLMTGVPNHKGMTIVDVLTSEDFLGPDPYLQTLLEEQEERFLFAVAVNSAWRFDRPYILEVDAPLGCELDSRGHSNYRVCLPEHPKRSFWLYAIGRRQENDFLKINQAQVKGPSGFHNFDYRQTESYNITREDIVRSSLFVHRHKLDDAVAGLQVPDVLAAFEKEGLKPTIDEENTLKHLGGVPGAFSVPVCRNPGGESISSVIDDRSRNYPCMCGEFTWNEGWAIEKDQTLRFLELTGFGASEDWEAYCSRRSLCEGENSIDWHAELEAKRKKGDPAVAKHLRHPFKKCKFVHAHDHYGKPEQDK